jgi:hypothetical protein
VHLLDARQQVDTGALLGVVRAALVRVLAVAEVGHLGVGRDERVRQRLDVAEPARDRGLVRSGRRERLRRERASRRERELTRLAQLCEHGRVPLGAADRRAVGEVLRRAAQHRRPADVDHLDRVLLADPPLRRHLREGVEVHADEVERPDLVLVQRGEVVVAVTPGEDGRMDARMERLDAAAEHLRDARELLDALDVEADLGLQVIGRSAAGNEVEPGLRQPARELLQAGLVVTADQRAAPHSSLTTSGSSRCSTA